jgi:hypothetical protein
MKTASILAFAGVAAAVDYVDFKVHNLKANMPNGYKFGYYYVDFNVTSQAGASPSTSWCYRFVSSSEALPCTNGPTNMPSQVVGRLTKRCPGQRMDPMHHGAGR